MCGRWEVLASLLSRKLRSELVTFGAQAPYFNRKALAGVLIHSPGAGPVFDTASAMLCTRAGPDKNTMQEAGCSHVPPAANTTTQPGMLVLVQYLYLVYRYDRHTNPHSLFYCAVRFGSSRANTKYFKYLPL